jgi:hypothetical protein
MSRKWDGWEKEKEKENRGIGELITTAWRWAQRYHWGPGVDPARVLRDTPVTTGVRGDDED